MRIAYALAALAALAPAVASAGTDGPYGCTAGFGGMMSGWGGMMGYGAGGWASSIITTILVWLVLGLLAAYLWKKVK